MDYKTITNTHSKPYFMPDDFKPSFFMGYVAFCTSHKATVKRMKNKSKRSR